MPDLLDFMEPRNRSVQERFEAFHRTNPHVFTQLVALARYAKSKGKRVGIKLLWERLRWDFVMEIETSDEFKLNNNLHSRYARLIADTYPDEFAGYFELRKLKAE